MSRSRPTGSGRPALLRAGPLAAGLVFAACGPADPPADDGAPSDTSPEDSGATDSGPADTADSAGWQWDPGEAAWTAAQVGERVDAALSVGLPDPPLLLDWYDRSIEEGDVGMCPKVRDHSMGEAFGGCLSNSGWIYAGISMWYASETGEGWEMDGDCYMRDPQGNWFYCDGVIGWEGDGAGAWEITVAGLWGYDLADGWVAAQPDAAVWMAWDGGTLTLDGGWSAEGQAVYFAGVSVTAEGATGDVQLRDPSGAWYTLTLDGGSCGDVRWDDASLGEGCVDLPAAAADLVARMEAAR